MDRTDVAEAAARSCRVTTGAKAFDDKRIANMIYKNPNFYQFRLH